MSHKVLLRPSITTKLSFDAKCCLLLPLLLSKVPRKITVITIHFSSFMSIVMFETKQMCGCIVKILPYITIHLQNCKWDTCTKKGKSEQGKVPCCILQMYSDCTTLNFQSAFLLYDTKSILQQGPQKIINCLLKKVSSFRGRVATYIRRGGQRSW